MDIVSAAEFQRHIGLIQDRALSQPIVVTRNGRERLVLMSAEEYRRLKSLDRQSLFVEELDTVAIAAIESASVPDEFSHLDHEVDDGQ